LSKKQHNKQVQKARERRRQQAYARRQRRQRIIIIVMVVLMVLSLVAVGLSSLFADTGTPAIDALDDGSAAADPDAAPEDAVADDTESAAAEEGPCAAPGEDDVPAPVTEAYDDPPRYDVDPGTTYQVRIETTCGDLLVGLDTDGAPRTAENFLALAADGYYAGAPFHRVIEGFMAQGGDPTGTGTGCLDAGCEVRLPGYAFGDELETAQALPASEQSGSVLYPRGAVAMANSGPDTQGSQFFVVHEDSPLPPAYTVFGEVLEGIEVVDDIVAGPVAGDQAIDPVVILAVDIEES
jgi:cyclophilin family peptidyl-prolyl cis-trans isomerase